MGDSVCGRPVIINPSRPYSVAIADENSHDSATLSGDADHLARIMANIKEVRSKILTATLKIDQLYHSDYRWN